MLVLPMTGEKERERENPLLLADPLVGSGGGKKKDPHTLAHANIERPDCRYQKLKIYIIRNEFRWLRIHASSIRNNALYGLTLKRFLLAVWVQGVL